MNTNDVVELSKIKLHNLPIAKNDSALIKFIYLGVSELYKRFSPGLLPKNT